MVLVCYRIGWTRWRRRLWSPRCRRSSRSSRSARYAWPSRCQGSPWFPRSGRWQRRNWPQRRERRARKFRSYGPRRSDGTFSVSVRIAVRFPTMNSITFCSDLMAGSCWSSRWTRSRRSPRPRWSSRNRRFGWSSRSPRTLHHRGNRLPSVHVGFFQVGIAIFDTEFTAARILLTFKVGNLPLNLTTENFDHLTHISFA